MRIAILEDDVALAGLVEMTLAEAGHSCEVFGDGQVLTRALHRTTYDLLILDWNVPGMTGLAIIEWTRGNLEVPPPALMLTSRSAEEDIVAGLSAGADDYVIKPVAPAVLKATESEPSAVTLPPLKVAAVVVSYTLLLALTPMTTTSALLMLAVVVVLTGA